MKNSVKKLITIINLSIALLLISILMMTALGVVGFEALDNTIVKNILYVLAAAFLLTGVVEIYYAFFNDDVLRNLILQGDSNKSASISRRAIVKIIKKAFYSDKNIRVRSVKLYADKSGPYVTVIVSFETQDVPSLIDYAQRVTKEALLKVLDITLNHIEIRITKLKTIVDVDKESILSDTTQSTDQPAIAGDTTPPETETPIETDDVTPETEAPVEDQLPIENSDMPKPTDTPNEPTYEDYVEGIMYKE